MQFHAFLSHKLSPDLLRRQRSIIKRHDTIVSRFCTSNTNQSSRKRLLLPLKESKYKTTIALCTVGGLLAYLKLNPNTKYILPIAWLLAYAVHLDQSLALDKIKKFPMFHTVINNDSQYKVKSLWTIQDQLMDTLSSIILHEDVRQHLKYVEAGCINLTLEYLADERINNSKVIEKLLHVLRVLFEAIDENTSQLDIPVATLGVALYKILHDSKLNDMKWELAKLGDALNSIMLQDSSLKKSIFTVQHSEYNVEIFVNALLGYLEFCSPSFTSISHQNQIQFGMWAITQMLRLCEHQYSHFQCVLNDSLAQFTINQLIRDTSSGEFIASVSRTRDLQHRYAELVQVLIHTSLLPNTAKNLLDVGTTPKPIYFWLEYVERMVNEGFLPHDMIASECLRALTTSPNIYYYLEDLQTPAVMQSVHQLAQNNFDRSGRRHDTVKTHIAKTAMALSRNYTEGTSAMAAFTYAHPVKVSADWSFPMYSKLIYHMSSAFKSSSDFADLPLIGAEEYDAVDTDLGWIDILTSWSLHDNPTIRQSAVSTLVNLTMYDESKPNSDSNKNLRDHIVQAWLLKLLQSMKLKAQATSHLRPSYQQDILAIKQIEVIAQLASEEFTPGNELRSYDDTITAAALNTLSVLANTHSEALLDANVVSLVVQVARAKPDMEELCARVLANISAAACMKSRVENEQGYSKQQDRDIRSILMSSSSGMILLDRIHQWYKESDDTRRSTFYRLTLNMAAFDNLGNAKEEKSDFSTSRIFRPVYYDGVHPIITSHGSDTSGTSDSILKSNDSGIDVVFVHGLRGDPFHTWRVTFEANDTDISDSNQQIWPLSLLSHDLQQHNFQNFRLLSLGYEANLMRNSTGWPSLSLDGRAAILLHSLEAANIGGSSSDSEVLERPVIFITHSMGGLLVKRILVRAYDNATSQSATADEMRHANYARQLLSNTKGIVFFAVPHFGSDLANAFRSETIRTLMRAHPAIADLCRNHSDRRLERLNTQFQELNIPCLSFGEELPAPLGIGLSSVVVQPESANPKIGHFEVVPYSDHMTICKMHSPNDHVYLKVLEFILKNIPN